ncbi:ECF transporter S component [Corynebacterium cystitidis]|uniref:ECF transporter S component n=1 Tax=Corynebacterium cystitidis TaxID=35757 RepID=UPI00211F0BBE|nr:ECF transporter S component [Corynebacterium cystitidis]
MTTTPESAPPAHSSLDDTDDTDDTKDAPGKARKRQRVATEVLMMAAAIGAAGGIIIAPISLFSSSGPALTFPPLYALLAAVKRLPGMLAQSLIRRPGVALLSMVVVGIINIPLVPTAPWCSFRWQRSGSCRRSPLPWHDSLEVGAANKRSER